MFLQYHSKFTIDEATAIYKLPPIHFFSYVEEVGRHRLSKYNLPSPPLLGYATISDTKHNNFGFEEVVKCWDIFVQRERNLTRKYS
jgi:hypothetical protein